MLATGKAILVVGMVLEVARCLGILSCCGVSPCPGLRKVEHRIKSLHLCPVGAVQTHSGNNTISEVVGWSGAVPLPGTVPMVESCAGLGTHVTPGLDVGALLAARSSLCPANGEKWPTEGHIAHGGWSALSPGCQGGQGHCQEPMHRWRLP
jgi:hypothetical protein